MARRRLLVRRIVTDVPARCSVRQATTNDLLELVTLITAHAEFEKVSIDTNGLVDRLAGSLVQPHGRATCFVAELEGVPGIVGYTTCSNEYSTWSGGDYLHMDTLFVDNAFRNQNIGKQLLIQVVEHAQSLGLTEVQWQTPDWNTDAERFYRRLGAQGSPKTRFKFAVDAAPRSPSNAEVLARFTTAWGARDENLLRLCLHEHAKYVPSVQVKGAPFEGLENVIEGIRMMWKVDDDPVVELGECLESGSHITRTWIYRFADGTSHEGIDVFTFADNKILKKDAYRR